jgi:DNA polymerase (family 10)
VPTGTPENGEVVAFLKRLAALMELSGANGFRVRAFDNAARMLEELEVDIAEMSAAGTLTQIDGIGKGLAEVIAEYVERGTAATYDELTDTIPESLLELLRIPGLGTKKVKAIYDELGIASVDELAAACHEGRLDGLPGFGRKTQENILKGIEGLSRFAGQYRLDQALGDAQRLVEGLEALPQTQRVSVAGSLRRHKEIVKDVDIVLSTDDPAAVSQAFVELPGVDDIIAQGERKTSVRMASGIAVDLRLVADEHFASMLHHFTGSKDHNVGMRSRALARDMHLNEYGLFHGRKGEGQRLDTPDETALFEALDLTFVAPELREGLGEIEAAEAGQLPELLTVDDIRGMLHVHTDASDGDDSLEAMVAAVRERGYDHVAICDHSKSAGYVFGLKEADIEAQHAAIDELQAGIDDGFRILKGIEADILKDGRLDYDDDVLATFDLVVVAVHNAMAMDEATLTRRIVTALEHPATNILAHPTGRLLLEREGMPVNLEEILAAAAANDVALELNTHPQRFDLDWRWLKRARDAGCRVAVNTDAHRIAHLDNLEMGCGIARKGWLEARDVINTLSADDLLAWARPD